MAKWGLWLGLLVAAACVYLSLVVADKKMRDAQPVSVGSLTDEELAKELERWQEVKAMGELWEEGVRKADGEEEVEVVRNRATQESWWFGYDHEGSDESFEMYEGMTSKGFVNVEHIHPDREELVVILVGEVKCTVQDGKEFSWSSRILKPGDWLLVPPGGSHALESAVGVADEGGAREKAGEEVITKEGVVAGSDANALDVVMRVRYTPAGDDMKVFFRTLGTLSRSPVAMTWMPGMPGIPDPIHTALLWHEFPSLSAFWWLPSAVQNCITAGGVLAARCLGMSL